jgi:hypothetical protein
MALDKSNENSANAVRTSNVVARLTEQEAYEFDRTLDAYRTWDDQQQTYVLRHHDYIRFLRDSGAVRVLCWHPLQWRVIEEVEFTDDKGNAQFVKPALYYRLERHVEQINQWRTKQRFGHRRRDEQLDAVAQQMNVNQ